MHLDENAEKRSTFGARLKEERKRLGHTQTSFGQLGSVSKRTQINYESGSMVPDTNYLLAIAAAGADLDYVLQLENARKGDFSGLSAEEQQLVHDYRHCSEKEQKAAREAMAIMGEQSPETEE